jgi:hypothetical protein
MKRILGAAWVITLAFSAMLQAQEAPAGKTPPCLVVASYGTDGFFAYRDQYNVPADHLQPAYSRDELNFVMKSGVKVVVYDAKEHESFADARDSCFAPAFAPAMKPTVH